MTWDSRDDFKADMASPTVQAATDDLANFTSASGVLFVESDVVK
jgi:hypothetical protein